MCFSARYNFYNLQVPATEANYTTNNLYNITQPFPTCTLLSFRLCIYQFRHFGALTTFLVTHVLRPTELLGDGGERKHGETMVNLWTYKMYTLNSTRWNKMDICALNSGFQDVLEVHVFSKKAPKSQLHKVCKVNLSPDKQLLFTISKKNSFRPSNAHAAPPPPENPRPPHWRKVLFFEGCKSNDTQLEFS